MTREQKHKIREAEEREHQAFMREMMRRLYPNSELNHDCSVKPTPTSSDIGSRLFTLKN